MTTTSVSTTPAPAGALAVTAASPGRPAASTGDTSLKPPVDWWQVGENRYESTAELIQNLRGSDGVQASYHFRETDENLTPPGKAADTLAKMVLGASLGAGVVAVGVIGMNFLAGLGTALTAGFYGSPNFLPLAMPALVGAGVGAAGGLVVGLSGSQGEAPPTPSASVWGVVKKESTPRGDRVKFYPGGDVRTAIDLNDYARARDPDPVGDLPQQPWWKDSLKGAGAGLAASAGSLVPILGLFAPTMALAKAGERATGGKLYGAVAGGVAGAAASAGTWSAIAQAGWTGLAVALGASAVAGAVAGPLVLPKLRQAEAEEAKWGDQWWRRSWQD